MAFFADRQVYCYGDPLFFETPTRGTDEGATFAALNRPVPSGWQRVEREVWVSLVPVGHAGPEQGWKIHVSAGPTDAGRVCETVFDYCVGRSVPFKHLRDQRCHRIYNSKYAPRAASGKLAVIYPRDDSELERTLRDLAELLDGVEGPYILSDLRWRDGPLFVRYGAFKEMFCTVAGESVLAVRRPDGTLVPDHRLPTFKLPDWVSVPDFLAPSLTARSGGSIPYRVTGALHFSNAGGVYKAHRIADGLTAVLKEARPYAGLDGTGRDATARLMTERWALDRLAGLPGVPRLIETFEAGGHQFLAMEHVEGSNLWVWMARSHPMVVDDDPTEAQYSAYAQRAVAILDRIETALKGIHDRGLVFGDLHFGNVLVDADDEVHLIDYELAFEASDLDRKAGMYTMGFTPGEGTTGYDVDRYSLASLKAALFLPLEKVRTLDPGKLDQQLAIIGDRFPLPAGYVSGLRHDLTTFSGRSASSTASPLEVDLDAADQDWPAARRSMAAGILASATPGRDDRLFPGDVQQFTSPGGGITFGYGAAGVLWAMSATDSGAYAPGTEWLAAAAGRTSLRRPGFYDGLHGVAYALHHFGVKDQALDLVDKSAELTAASNDLGLFSGLAGIGLNSLHFAGVTGESGFRETAIGIGDRMAEALRQPGSAGDKSVIKAGLMRGWCGPALFFARLHEATGESAYLDLAVQAIHRDLDKCIHTKNGALQYEEGGVRTLAYLDVGSAGIALVADELLALRDDDRLQKSLPALLQACSPEFVVQPQLLSGRAGLLVALARNGVRDPSLDTLPVVHRHLRRLSWHALSYQGHLAFPGDFSLRLSMDLGTGVAGVLLSTAAVTGATGAFLPFFTPRPVRSPVGNDLSV